VPQAAPVLSWRRLGGRTSAAALLLATVGAAAEMVATVVTGRVAEGPTSGLVTVLAVLLVGSAVLDTAGRTLFSGVVGRAEGRLRADLLSAAFSQPLPTLEAQGVGELLDRVDDDTRQVATLLRRSGWTAGRASLRSVLAWVVAGVTWEPAWFAFPLVALAAAAVARSPAREVSRRKLAEEVAWSDHSAQLEEAVAGRDDVRSSLGQPHVVRRYAEGSAEVLRRVRATCASSTSLVLRTGLVLPTVLAALAVGGVALVSGGAVGVAELVTLWLFVTAFVGQLGQVSHQLPELQAGLGALSRIRSLLTAPQEPRGGAPVPPGPAAVEVRDLEFGYDGSFALRSLTLTVPAGTTCALVGRSGAGKSTLVKLLSRAVEPPPGSVLVGGQDVTATDVEDPAAGGRRRHPAHGAARGDPRGEHHAVRRRPGRCGRAGGGGARPDVVGRCPAAGPAHAAGDRRHDAVGGGGAARRVRPAARPRRRRGRARRGDRPHGPADRAPRDPGGRAAARRPYRHRGRAPPVDHPLVRRGRGARRRAPGAARPARAAGRRGRAVPGAAARGR
jgi:ATP-binding cassette subfamily B protein